MQVDAKKQSWKENEALALVKDVDEIYATKGQKRVYIDLKKAQPGRAELLALLLGPTGGLRAPTFRQERTLVVGFDEAIYKQLLS